MRSSCFRPCVGAETSVSRFMCLLLHHRPRPRFDRPCPKLGGCATLLLKTDQMTYRPNSPTLHGNDEHAVILYTDVVLSFIDPFYRTHICFYKYPCRDSIKNPKIHCSAPNFANPARPCAKFNTIDQAIRTAASDPAWKERHERLSLDVAILEGDEVDPARHDHCGAVYPVNTLRNLALLQVRRLLIVSCSPCKHPKP